MNGEQVVSYKCKCNNKTHTLVFGQQGTKIVNVSKRKCLDCNTVIKVQKNVIQSIVDKKIVEEEI